MPVSMQGAPLPVSPPVPEETDPNFLSFGSWPHVVPKQKLIFDPMRGGWVQPDKHKAGTQRVNPPHWDLPAPKAAAPHNVEETHYGKWQLDMKSEEELGLAPKRWSVSSSMDDERPNGQALFDARFYGQAMGRARGGYSMIADSRGMEFAAGKLAKAVNMDSDFFAEDMSDETALAAESAEKNKYGNNTNFDSFDGGAMALANMSALQRAALDDDGDGKVSMEELRADGLS